MDSRHLIDCHVHIWNIDELNYDWIPPDTSIYRNFSIDDYKKDKWQIESNKDTSIDGIVIVQALNSDEETFKCVEKSKNESLVKGIVGWVDLTNENVDYNIKKLKELSNGKLVGIRHILDYEENEWILKESVKRGILSVHNNNLSYDLLLRPHHLKHIPKLLTYLPKNMRLIIDHIAKPRMNSTMYDQEWFDDIRKISKESENVYCKLSGLVTEAPDYWSASHIEPYIKHVLLCFGWKRCIYGSDWPIFKMLNNCSFKDAYDLINSIVVDIYKNDKKNKEIMDAIFYKNGIQFYNLQQII